MEEARKEEKEPTKRRMDLDIHRKKDPIRSEELIISELIREM